MFIDTHTHIYTEEFDADRDEVVGRARAAGAEALLLPAVDDKSVREIKALCAKYSGFCFPMIGLHPTDIPDEPFPVLERMEEQLKSDASFIAVGEVGLDYYWDDSRKAVQQEVFRRQIEWARAYALPLVVHMRSAHEDIVNTLRPFAEDLRGVFHCFGGTEEEARELLDVFPYFCLGIGGVLTFKKSTLQEVLKASVPLGRIVVETDAPYLAPTPYRGKRNEPAYIPLVLDALAKTYGQRMEEVADITTRNARRIFSL